MEQEPEVIHTVENESEIQKMTDIRMIKPLACLMPDAAKDVGLIILNRPLEKPLLKRLWSRSIFKAVSDGGANRLFECMEEENSDFVPDLITGDFDSATESILEFYKKKSVAVLDTPDQDETDFTKCLRIVIEKTRMMEEIGQYVVTGCTGGRMDHEFANIETLFRAMSMTTKPVFLISEGSAACLLRPGKTVIEANTGMEDMWCGLIPVGQRCDHVTTTGLKWNLDNQALAFGELVSTSNTYMDAGQVTVETDGPLLWTMGYHMKCVSKK